MPALLDGVLPWVYSQGDRAKRYLGAALSDPGGALQQYMGSLNDQAGLGLGLLSASGSPVQPPTQHAQTARNALIDALGPAMMGATVWHGSPHVFDKFDASKIGTGEGNQMYGHGLYFAEAPEVAQQYATSLSQRYSGRSTADIQADIENVKANVQGPRRMDWLRQLNFDLEASKKPPTQPSVYKVDLPDDAIGNMVAWDKPISEQPAAFQKLVNDTAATRATEKGRALQLSDMRTDGQGIPLTPNSGGAAYQYLAAPRYGASPDDIAAKLRDLGIPGIRYLDGGSRGAGAGTSNYVVFPGGEGALSILERNGVPMNGN